ncbi:MAG: sigma-70 family RNA polymerase sigma factor [Muribaculaceae bacterium]|nr:sigma-70 family RNA polymerase sigma factor [Muribaculaceae bacterium]
MTTKNNIEYIFRSNYSAMFILANRMLRDKEMARDVVHDIFVKLFEEKIKDVNGSYLLNAVRFACLKYIRRESIHERFIKLQSIDLEETESDILTKDEDLERLNAIIDQNLPEQTRRILRMKFNNHLTYSEIAEELSVSEVTVYKHLKQAITTLRKYFNNNER